MSCSRARGSNYNARTFLDVQAHLTLPFAVVPKMVHTSSNKMINNQTVLSSFRNICCQLSDKKQITFHCIRVQLLKFYRNIIIIIEENFHYYKSISILINFFPFVKNSNKIRNDISTGEISFPNSVNRSKKQGIPIPSNAATIRLHPWNSLHKIRTDKRMQPPVYRSPTHAAPFHKRAGVWTGWRGREGGVGDGEQWAPRYRKGRRKLQPLA